jgi:hypothetical protein
MLLPFPRAAIGRYAFMVSDIKQNMIKRFVFVPTPFARELVLFLCAVLVGTAAGIGSQWLLLHLVGPQVAANLSLALATTCTGAAHSRMVHRKPIGHLLPSVVAGAPLAYGAMRMIHLVVGF